MFGELVGCRLGVGYAFPPLPYGGRIGGEGGGGVRVGGSFWCGVVWFKVVRCVFSLPFPFPPAPLWWEDWGGRGGRGWGGLGAKVGGGRLGCGRGCEGWIC